MSDSASMISTSAIAKSLELPLQQLFSTLKDYEWIRKVDDGWALTAKGEFEGGEYRHSRKYGRYIVWPESVLEHPLLLGLESNRLLSAQVLGKRFGLTAREVNRVFGECGLLRRDFNGWQLTERGLVHGGIQYDADHSGMAYAMWPESVLDWPPLQRGLVYWQQLLQQLTQGAATDLFSSEWRSPDGHLHTDAARLLVCHWLYMAGVNHALGRALPLDGAERAADFYLPVCGLYLQIAGEGAGAARDELALRNLCEQHDIPLVILRGDDLPRLDEILTRALRRFGVALL